MKKCEFEWVDDKHLKLSGIIDEYCSFAEVFKKLKDEIWIDFSGITRINSSGVREWVQEVVKSDVKIHFENCSSVIVDQFSMIPEFLGRNGIVESFAVHYVCENCSFETQKNFVVGKDIQPGKEDYDEVSEIKCPSCGYEQMELDHNPDIYFAFLKFIKSNQQAS